MAGFDFTDILKKVLGGGIFAPPTDPTKTGSVPAVPLKGALPVEDEEQQNGNYFSRMFHDDPTKQDALNSGLINAGAAMMIAGGPSSTPTNLLSVLGAGIGAGNKAYRGHQADAAETAANGLKLKQAQERDALTQGLLSGGSVPADGTDNPFSVARLKQVWEYQVRTGDDAGARDTLGMIQALQKEAAENGMTIGADGSMKSYDGYNEGLETTERHKATGRVAGEESQKRTDDIREYDFYVQQETAAGREPLDFGPWISKNNKEKTPNFGQNSNKFAEKSDEEAAKRYTTIVEQGAGASQMIGDMELLLDLGRKAQTGKGAQFMAAIGPYAEMAGVNIDGLSEIQAYDAVVSRIAPNLRPAGSGATSDFDAKQFLKSIPSIGNTAEGNELIATTMQAIAQNKLEAAEIAGRVQRGDITWQDGDAEIRKLANPYTRFKDWQKSKTSKNKPTESFEEMPREGPLRVLGVDTATTASTEPKDTPKPSGTVNTTQRDWDSAPSGTIFIWNGKRYKKP